MRTATSRGAESVKAGIVEAATDVLARKGIEAATIKEVAKAAGISPGLIYHYFDDKDRLLLEVLREARKRPRTGEFAAQALRGDDSHHRLRYELFVLGLRDQRFLPDLAALLGEDRRGIRHTHEDPGQRDTPGVSPLLLACYDGLALQGMADSDLDLGPAYRLIPHLPDLTRQRRYPQS